MIVTDFLLIGIIIIVQGRLIMEIIVLSGLNGIAMMDGGWVRIC